MVSSVTNLEKSKVRINSTLCRILRHMVSILLRIELNSVTKSDPTFAYSKSTIETLEKGVKYDQSLQ